MSFNAIQYVSWCSLQKWVLQLVNLTMTEQDKVNGWYKGYHITFWVSFYYSVGLVNLLFEPFSTLNLLPLLPTFFDAHLAGHVVQ